MKQSSQRAKIEVCDSDMQLPMNNIHPYQNVSLTIFTAKRFDSDCECFIFSYKNMRPLIKQRTNVATLYFPANNKSRERVDKAQYI